MTRRENHGEGGKKEHVEQRSKGIDPGAGLVLCYITTVVAILLLGMVRDGIGRELPLRISAAWDDGLTLVGPSGRLRAPLLEQEAHIEVTSLLGRTVLEQRFVNPTDEWVEAVYVFPLPEMASVDHLRMVVGDRTIEGKIMERRQARKVHEAAKKQGRKSSLLSQQRPNIFTTRIANIGPGEEVRVGIEYQQRVARVDSTFSLRFPMVVGPRYIPGRSLDGEQREDAPGGIVHTGAGEGWGVDTEQVKDGSSITPPVDLDGTWSPSAMIEVDLAPGFALSSLVSRYHEVVQEKLGPEHYRVALRGPVTADRDFVLEWKPVEGKEPSVALFSETVGTEEYQLLALMPAGGQNPVAAIRELILVLDISGSMAGASIGQAKAAAELALSRLRPEDRFNLIVFNNSCSRLFERAVSATPEMMRIATTFLRQLKARGGTEMAAAVKLALDNEHHHDRLRQVIFITDGAVGNERELFELIGRRLGDSRLFPVGIGSAPNGHFMRGAAILGRGAYTYIGAGREVAEKMNELFSKLEHPVLTDLRLEFGGENLHVESYPDPIPDLYSGEPLVVVLRRETSPAQLTITGRLGGKHWSRQVELHPVGRRQGIAGLWGREKIAGLMRKLVLGAEESTIRQQVVETALAHHLVSKYTSLVAVDARLSRLPENHQAVRKMAVPTALPAGWQAGSVFGGGPQTGTMAELLCLVGFVLLGLGGLLLAVIQWRSTRQRREWQANGY